MTHVFLHGALLDSLELSGRHGDPCNSWVKTADNHPFDQIVLIRVDTEFFELFHTHAQETKLVQSGNEVLPHCCDIPDSRGTDKVLQIVVRKLARRAPLACSQNCRISPLPLHAIQASYALTSVNRSDRAQANDSRALDVLVRHRSTQKLSLTFYSHLVCQEAK